MGVTVIVGGFYGDEGKGKIVAFHALKTNPDASVRAGVGPNAGHTVKHQGVVARLRLVPSSFVNTGTKLMIAPGVLVDENVLLKEIDELGVGGRLLVDRKSGLIEARHIERDRGDEHLAGKIGTTGTGTGPAMEDRVGRRLRLAEQSERLKPFLGDTVEEVQRAVEEGRTIVAEGTQGTFLSLYHGTYPYVTSKDVTASSVLADIGVGPRAANQVIVVFKSFVTRVGNGPLANELPKDEVETRGWVERGSVTGRLRRAAPFDFELAKRAVRLNGATALAITKLDAVFRASAGVTRFEDLPKEARDFIRKVEDETGVPVIYAGTGEEVLETVVVPH